MGSGKCDELLTSSLVAAIFRSSPSVVIFHTADRSPQNDFGSLSNYLGCYNDSTRDILNFDFSLFCGRVEIWCGVFFHSKSSPASGLGGDRLKEIEIAPHRESINEIAHRNKNCSGKVIMTVTEKKNCFFLRFSLRAALIARLDLHVKYLYIFSEDEF